ncbi:MAG TPA: pyridoxal-phosphate dependent enzyme [Longilinea sp.]|nr:pyridoxal-phosphate dependent enzyme [Longilinea sp.]
MRVSGFVRMTPLTFDPKLNLILKWENHQVTGSFKLRGAANKILSLTEMEQKRGLVAASAGNHGQGVALVARQVGCRSIVFCPSSTPLTKLNAMRALGAELHLIDGDYATVEKQAEEYAIMQQMTWISPYNDGQVIAGQGTIGLEILRQMDPFVAKVCVVPIGGGGMLSGIGAAFENIKNPVKIIGAQSTASPFFHSLFHHGNQSGQVELPSLADGLAGAVEENSITIPMVNKYAQDIILVDEEEIGQAIAFCWYHFGERIEGSAAAALAAVLTGKISERPALVILSGGNIQPELHQELIDRWPLSSMENFN